MQACFSTFRFLAVLLLAAFTANLSAFAAADRPNIVFIFSDDHAVQSIGAYGSKINQTPNIDRLAEEGSVFLHSFCANSICGPSRASILTGKHSHLNGFRRNGERFDGSQTTFPKIMRGAGYQTALVGKWHLSSDPTGFQYWEILPGQGSYYNPDFLQMDGSRKRYTGYCTDIVTDRALKWLDEDRDKSKPFILLCQHKAPHRNWSPALRHLSMFDGKDVPEPDSLFDDYSGRTPLLKENEMSLENHFHWGHDAKFRGDNLYPDHFKGLGNGQYRRMNAEQRAAWDAQYEPENQAFLAKMKAGALSQKDIVRWKYQRYIKDYLRTIAAVDESVGRILDYLDENGLRENTVVIYSSDQGFYLGEHGWYDKRWMFEESLKMPFLVRWPGVIAPGTKSTALIQNIDYAPTFLDVADIPIPEEMQGRSLLPVFKNDAPSDWRDAIYYAYYENASAHAVPIHDGIRTQDHKLMFFPRGQQWQLFDLAQDPQEMQSVHADPQYRTVFQALQKRYRDLRKFYEVNTAAIPMTRGDEDWWKQRNQQVNQKARDGGFDLVFIGDSITQGWEGRGKAVWEKFYSARNPINLGFSGDRTEHVLWRLTRGNLSHVQPKVAVLMIGTNNTGHHMQEPGEIASGVGAVLDVLRERVPNSKVLLLGVFPRGKDAMDEKRLNNLAVNQYLRRFHDGRRVHYLDIGNAFLESDGTISRKVMPDYLHLSEEGYARWAQAIEPKLAELGL